MAAACDVLLELMSSFWWVTLDNCRCVGYQLVGAAS